jgi:hypothetical protein
MARKKFNSSALKKLKDRLNGLKAIDAQLVLKNGLSIEAGQKIQTELEAEQNEYNITLTNVDAQRQRIAILEKNASDFSKNALTGVKNDFGDSSIEYQKAGGTPMHLKTKPIKKIKLKLLS